MGIVRSRETRSRKAHDYGRIADPLRLSEIPIVSGAVNPNG